MPQSMRQEVSLTELEQWSKDLVKDIKPQTLILLDGDLGAGKTCLSQHILKALGGDQALSPTFSLINHYQAKKITDVYHVDLYRITDGADLESSGFWDLMANNQDALIIIEWASRLDIRDLPRDWQKIFITIQSHPDKDNVRTYLFKST
jgi:tRNA threonylcarbamoyladenosine biosynthesis protein TsaE